MSTKKSTRSPVASQLTVKAMLPAEALRIAQRHEMWQIDSLEPYEHNARTHSPEQVEKIAASILRFGFNAPILVDIRGGIVAGHGRLSAAKALGMTEVPVVVLDHLSPEERRAYLIADNRLAELAGWDDSMLLQELSELGDLGIDADLLGFAAKDLDELNASVEQAAIELSEDGDDNVPEPPDKATTVKGDVWILGASRLMCGDSSSSEDVDRLLAGARIHLVNMDPPYNVRVEPRSNNAIAAGLSSFQATHHQKLDVARHPEKAQGTTEKLRPKDRPLQNDFISDESFAAMLRAWFGNASRALEPGRGFYIWGGYANCANYPSALKEHELYFSQAVIWIKEHPVLTRKDFMGNHEWCFYGWREGAAHEFFGPANVPDVWSVKKLNHTAMVHLTEKPVELALRALMYSSRAGENVLDLFGGSGSTLIAAEKLDRHAYVMELDELYCDVIITRWQEFTGKSAVHEASGKTFDELKAERASE